MMDNMQKLQRGIEALRKRLDEEAGKGVMTDECYQISVQIDQLVQEYMQCKERKGSLGKEITVQKNDWGAGGRRVDLPSY